MEVKYRPPSNDELECSWLEENFFKCLKEKAAKDDVETMECKVENILWFMTECPNKYAKFENPATLRQLFIKEKLQEE